MLKEKNKTIAIAQYNPYLGDLDKNLKKHKKYIEKAIKRKSDIIIFPELSLTGYLLKDLVYDIAINESDPRLSELVNLSNKIDIVLGFVEKGEDRLIYNSCIYLSKGNIINKYRKIRLPNFGMFEEKKFFSSGDKLSYFNTMMGKTGILICRDFLFPSLTYSLYYKGMDFLIAISNAPLRGIQNENYDSQIMWEDAGKAYSRFFSMFVIYVNRVGFEDGFGFAGGSFVSGPDGKIVFRAPALEEDIYYCNIDLEERDKARTIYTYYRDENFKQIKKFLDEK